MKKGNNERKRRGRKKSGILIALAVVILPYESNNCALVTCMHLQFRSEKNNAVTHKTNYHDRSAVDPSPQCFSFRIRDLQQ